ncbi:MAG: hypothetical protein KC912_02185 [Proteobacteria bacterium]|nr:hypothetical protein [Pseudomonadota bacterium]
MKFGTDGIRGPAGEWPVTVEGALRVGRAAARLADGKPVVVAVDRRPSSGALEAAVIAGVTDMGAVARRAGVLPTAGLSEALACGLGGAGVMLTASHNAASDNGFKILGPGGAKPSDATVATIEAWLNADEPGGRLAAVEDVGEAALGAHIKALEARINLERFHSVALGLDLANGAGVRLWPWLQSLGPAWSALGVGEGVENDDCGAVHPERLGVLVRESGARAGVAVDGDADRCVLVDEQGRKVHGDVLAWWLTRAAKLPSLAVTVMTTHALEAALPMVDVTRTPVGDRHLHAAMQLHGIAIGVEESGHALFEDGLPTGCGLLTGLRALSTLLESDVPVSEQLSAFVPWPRFTAKVRVTARPPLDDVEAVQQAIAEVLPSLDGGRTLLRYSGTEPVLRILVEGPTSATVQAAGEHLVARATQALA